MTDQTRPNEAERLVEVARGFVPRIRELAPRMQAERKLDDQLVEDMDKAGLFSILSPKRWGGPGLGVREAVMGASKIVDTLGGADCSTAWVTSFYMVHNWLLAKFPLEVQKKLFAKGPSVRGAGVFGPPGKAVRVDGGYRVTGRWPYASGIWHGSSLRAPLMIDGALNWGVFPREDLELVDDWHMEAMSATASVTMVANDVFIADGWYMPVDQIIRPSPTPIHDDAIFRLPFSALAGVCMSLALGALDRGVEVAREKLLTAIAQGVPRIQVPAARVRWAEAYERSRVMRLVFDAMTEDMLKRPLAGLPPTLESEANSQLHLMHFLHGAKDALRLLVDGLGTSTYRTNNPLYRIAQDVGMLATHGLGADYDMFMDRHARWVLGLGLQPGDPGARLSS